jgi:hypothetical protein
VAAVRQEQQWESVEPKKKSAKNKDAEEKPKSAGGALPTARASSGSAVAQSPSKRSSDTKASASVSAESNPAEKKMSVSTPSSGTADSSSNRKVDESDWVIVSKPQKKAGGKHVEEDVSPRPVPPPAPLPAPSAIVLTTAESLSAWHEVSDSDEWLAEAERRLLLASAAARAPVATASAGAPPAKTEAVAQVSKKQPTDAVEPDANIWKKREETITDGWSRKFAESESASKAPFSPGPSLGEAVSMRFKRSSPSLSTSGADSQGSASGSGEHLDHSDHTASTAVAASS